MSRSPDNRPIIVGGCHRSGTSLIRRILNAHSRIHCGPEVPFFRDLTGDYADDPVGHLRFMSAARTLLPERELEAVLGSAFVSLHAHAAARAGKARWADKAPENVLHTAGWERLLGDGWVFVHVVRNPLDALASMAETPFPRTLPSGLGQRASFYSRYVEAGLAFVEAHPGRACTVLYEDLATSPEPTIRSLMTWLGEDAEPGQLSFNDSDHGIGLEDPKIAGTDRVHADSVGRWRRDLTKPDVELAWSLTASLWRRIDPQSRWIPGDERVYDAPAGGVPADTGGAPGHGVG